MKFSKYGLKQLTKITPHLCCVYTLIWNHILVSQDYPLLLNCNYSVGYLERI